ncbi:MAG: S8 family serine peptidase, partial [Anaerolineae bacterium]|nr:S8 family serine peptidase [Anaerolineae bacterium]
MRRIRSLPLVGVILMVILVLMVAVSFSLATTASTQTADAAAPVQASSTFMAGQVIVRAKPGGLAKLADLADKSGYAVVDKIEKLDLTVYRVPAGAEMQAVEAFRSNPDVAYAELNGLVSETVKPLRAGRPDSLNGASAVPTFNDPYLGYQWNLRSVEGLAALGVSRGGGVTVAVIGSGVALDNPELTPRLVPGYNFVDNTTTPVDDHGFGTFNAGIIGATANNNVGIVGVAPEVSLMPIKALRRNGDRLEI